MEADILMKLTSQKKYAKIQVQIKTIGIAIFAESLKPIRNKPANKIGEKAKKV